MQQAILDYPKQFAFQPKIVNADKLVAKHHIAVLGMGGSQLLADIVQCAQPERSILHHRDYGLPTLSDHEEQNTLFIASSYSGNTEETLSGYNAARERGLALAVVTVGGELLNKAQADATPYIQLPNTGIQPRMATGLSVVALLALLKDTESLKKVSALSSIDPKDLQPEGERIAGTLQGNVPLVYASARNAALAYTWKITMNETAKIPAFCNVMPELNHNEMNGFDLNDTTKELADRFHILLLQDAEDDPRIARRFEELKALYEKRGIPVEEYSMSGVSRWERIIRTLLIADWCALTLTEQHGAEPEAVPMVEEFKKRLAA